jgi:iron complex outermembrane receptor protein
MDIQVTSVSKKEQKLSHTAAAVFVITQDDIRRSGGANLPDVLMMAPGIQVARIDTTRWAITSRGFNGEYSNKMLVLVDGRSVYDAIFSGVHLDAQNVPLEDIERIEVIRGPGASVWDANAVNGVINVITRTASDTKGGLVSGAGGTDADFFDMARYGASAGFTDYRLYSSDFRRSTLHEETGIGSGDDWTMMSLGFRSDSVLRNGDTLTLQAEGQRDRYGNDAWKLEWTTIFRSPAAGGIVGKGAPPHSNGRPTVTHCRGDGARSCGGVTKTGARRHKCLARFPTPCGHEPPE